MGHFAEFSEGLPWVQKPSKVMLRAKKWWLGDQDPARHIWHALACIRRWREWISRENSTCCRLDHSLCPSSAPTLTPKSYRVIQSIMGSLWLESQGGREQNSPIFMIIPATPCETPALWATHSAEFCRNTSKWETGEIWGKLRISVSLPQPLYLSESSPAVTISAGV